MKAHICGRIAAVAVFLLVNHTAAAQSETSEECMRKIGAYALNFNAYQAATGSNRFCDDIPLTGPTVLTLDFVDPELRQMPAEARLLEVESWPAALDGSSDGKALVLQRLPSKTYSSGLIEIDHTFKAPGYYVEVVSIKAPNGKKHVLRFPFQVAGGAVSDWSGLGLWAAISAILVLVAGAAFWFFRRKGEEV
ncbi:MAG: hypothetical protein USCGTAYLOR_00685 [Chromatiales bacterium USCg_Taylor]|nr:MAG: hypothetical protein USCGTAYLOR_00685 [Chromatiales bacterium USCg_Taylor]